MYTRTKEEVARDVVLGLVGGGFAGALLERVCSTTERSFFKPIYAVGGALAMASPSPLATFCGTLAVELVGGLAFNADYLRWDYRLQENVCGQIAFPHSLILATLASVVTWRANAQP